MKFSVVIPLYNKARYIGDTLRSVLAQTFTDYEVLVVDDGSRDDSLAAARQVQSDKIRVIPQENQGVSVARNTGIAHARGEYIAFLDADDQWHSNYLETIHRLTEAYPDSGFYVTAYEVDMGDGKVHYSARRTPETGCVDSYWRTLAGGYDFVWTSATVIRRALLLEAGGFRPGELIGQDLDMWARVARIHPRVAYSAAVCVRYNRGAECNARTRVKIAWAGAFLRDLEEELDNPARTPEEISAIQWKYDKKMTAYIFTAIMAGEKARAAEALRQWKGHKSLRTRLLQMGLWGAQVMPTRLNQWIYGIRLKVF